jgi:hypothetical protein
MSIQAIVIHAIALPAMARVKTVFERQFLAGERQRPGFAYPFPVF